MVTMDVPPYCMVHGNRATLVQINSLGLSRSGFSNEDITKLKTIFRKLFFKSNNEKFTDNLENLEQEYSGFEPATKLFNFIKSSKRGICQYKE
ncbi:MAG: hypothetical protein HRU35_07670 [Rickettsiaceae bacterium]|nr:hypothetical protein [Rickettsiaceae bacterium]